MAKRKKYKKERMSKREKKLKQLEMKKEIKVLFQRTQTRKS